MFDGGELFYSTGQVDYLAAVWFFFIDADDGVANEEHFWGCCNELGEVGHFEVFIFYEGWRDEAHAHGVHGGEDDVETGCFGKTLNLCVVDFLLQRGHFDFDDVGFFGRAVDVGVFCIYFIYVILDDSLECVEGAEVFHDGFAYYFVFIVHGPFYFDFGKLVEKVVYVCVAEGADFFAAGKEQCGVDFHG